MTRMRLIKIGELAANKRRPTENVQDERLMHLSIQPTRLQCNASSWLRSRLCSTWNEPKVTVFA